MPGHNVEIIGHSFERRGHSVEMVGHDVEGQCLSVECKGRLVFDCADGMFMVSDGMVLAPGMDFGCADSIMDME